MSNIATDNFNRLTEAFSLALEDRSQGYQDLVSNSNVILYTMQEKGMMKPYSGPTIRERLLFNETGSSVWYTGNGYLNPKPAQLFNDAEWTPKQFAISVQLTGTEILNNAGPNQLMDIMEAHISGAEQEMEDYFVEALHGDGTSNGGLAIGGLQLAVPTVVDSGTYGSIPRSNTQWQTRSYDIANDFDGAPYAIESATKTSLVSDNVYEIFQIITEELTLGNAGPDLIVSSPEHYRTFALSTKEIQRITDENALGKLGFANLKFYGVGRAIDVVLEGGQGSAMPANTTYFLNTDDLCLRYHPERNFTPIGQPQMPINQDAIVTHLGWMGELTQKKPRHSAKLYTS